MMDSPPGSCHGDFLAVAIGDEALVHATAGLPELAWSRRTRRRSRRLAKVDADHDQASSVLRAVAGLDGARAALHAALGSEQRAALAVARVPTSGALFSVRLLRCLSKRLSLRSPVPAGLPTKETDAGSRDWSPPDRSRGWSCVPTIGWRP